MGKMPCPVTRRMTTPAEDERPHRHQTTEAAEAGNPTALPGASHVCTAEDGCADDPRGCMGGDGWSIHAGT